jgi:hypothetical protein
MTTLTPDEQRVLESLPTPGAKPAIACDSNVALRLSRRGLAVPTPVRWLNFPLFARSQKGEHALRRHGHAG